MKLKAIHVDDVPACLEILKKELQGNEGVELVASIDNYDEALLRIPKLKPQILFLDIRLGGGKTGYELLKKLNMPGIAVIFITQYEEYIQRAMEFSMVNHLIKNIYRKEQLAAAIETAKAALLQPLPILQIETFYENLIDPRKILVEDDKVITLLNLMSIAWIDYEDNVITIHYMSMSQLRQRKLVEHLSRFVELLQSIPESENSFVRINNHQAINVARVSEYNKKSMAVELMIPHQSGNKTLSVSRRLEKNFLSALRANAKN